MSGVDTRHPDYLVWADEWRLMRDCAEGARAIKEAGELYLPRPTGFGFDADGNRMYDAYTLRAQVREILAPAITSMVGIIHHREIRIEMPDRMAAIWESATPDKQPLEVFHEQITAELLTTGRYAILAGASSRGSDLPYLVGYSAEKLINWAETGDDFFVLDESGRERAGYDWREVKRYRVLTLENGRYVTRTFSGDNLAQERTATPMARGEQALNQIPLVVMGPRRVGVEIEAPPLVGIARAMISMYQLSADYRWQLFMTGQETLVVINGDAPDRVGAGAVIVLKAGGEAGAPLAQTIQPDVKYVGPKGAGIEAHRKALEDEMRAAAEAGAKMFNMQGGGSTQESGEARRMRFTAETASLMSVARASCAGLEKGLRHVGRMMGLPDAEIEKIVVHPPKRLIDRKLTPDEINALVALWERGLLGYETIYANLQDGDIASPERDHEQERNLIDAEEFKDEPSDEERAAMGLGAPANPPAPEPV